jgi:hypothetical protein
MSSEVRAVKVKRVFLLTKLLFVFIKHSQIMGIQLKFYGTEKTETQENSLEVFINSQEEITILIKDESVSHDFNRQLVSLDKPTAIRLSRELRKQIALLD